MERKMTWLLIIVLGGMGQYIRIEPAAIGLQDTYDTEAACIAAEERVEAVLTHDGGQFGATCIPSFDQPS